MKKLHKVLLDRSIFHGAKFDQLASSKLRLCIQKSRVQVFSTPQLVEETMRFGLANKNKPVFERHWRFLKTVNTGKWFRLAEDIVALELRNQCDKPHYYLLPKPDIQFLFERVQQFLGGDLPTDGLQDAVKKIEHSRNRLAEFREKRLALRALAKPQQLDFNKYYSENIDWVIEEGLMKFHIDSTDYLKTWRTRKHLCRFTESYTRAWFATILLPTMDHNLRLDLNDRADAEQLAYLLWTDIMVSDDTRFMKACFDMLYRGTVKRLMTLSQFLDFVNTLS